jgi:hypothetical protein
VKHWEIIANNLSKAGWSWGCVSTVDCNGRTIWKDEVASSWLMASSVGLVTGFSVSDMVWRRSKILYHAVACETNPSYLLN